MCTEFELIEKIKNHELENQKEARELYNSFCDILKEKYGLVDRDYDDNPTRRGKEWIDIHHIREYELDDIARRTSDAKYIEKLKSSQSKDEIVVIKSKTFYDDKAKANIKKLHPNAAIYALDYTLEELKPYNTNEQLVYANKIEHFLLHYLIDSLRGRQIFSGGPNYLWDDCIALDCFGFDKEYMNIIKSQKDSYYLLISSEEITRLYKKLIDWKKWDLSRCSLYWKAIKYMIRYLDEKGVSFVEDKDKFFKLLNIVGYEFDDETKNKITSLPFKIKIIDWFGEQLKSIKDSLYSLDEKTLVRLSFDYLSTKKSVTISDNIETIGENAFYWGAQLEKITIPTSVKKIEDKAFVLCYRDDNSRRCPLLSKIRYKGTQQEWDEKFSNVNLDGITLVCQKANTSPKVKDDTKSLYPYNEIVEIFTGGTIRLIDIDIIHFSYSSLLHLECASCGHRWIEEINAFFERRTCPNCSKKQ